MCSSDLLFAWDTDPDLQIMHNIRLAARIINQPDPTSQVLRDFINSTRGGLQTRHQRLFIGSISQSGNGQWHISYGHKIDQPYNSIPMDDGFFFDSPTDSLPMQYNIGAFLRINNHTSLTPEAIAAVAAARFRGW